METSNPGQGITRSRSKKRLLAFYCGLFVVVSTAYSNFSLVGGPSVFSQSRELRWNECNEGQRELHPPRLASDQNSSLASNTTRRTSDEQAKILPDFIKDYIEFHRSSIDAQGRLKPGVKFLVYECKANQKFETDLKRHCGGIGDRLNGIFHLLYIAICTGRVLLIESDFPFPLENFLIPREVYWNATYDYNATRIPVHSLQDEMKSFPFELIKPGHMGVRFEHSHTFPALSTWTSRRMKKHFRSIGQVKPTFVDEQDAAANLSYWAFHSLFRLTDPVLERANDLKKLADMPWDDELNQALPYISAHLRTGDQKFQFEMDIPRKRFLDWGPEAYKKFLQCARKLKRNIPRPKGVYLASDNSDAKDLIRTWDSSVRIPSAIVISHVDVPLEHNGDNQDAFHGMMDGWAELVVLMQSECIVMSDSQYGVLATVLSRKNCTATFYRGQCFIDKTSVRAVQS